MAAIILLYQRHRLNASALGGWCVTWALDLRRAHSIATLDYQMVAVDTTVQ